ncbi:MAG: DNA modification methylase [bacterium]|nr:DNA modification methylase [bacterium]
MGEVKLDMIPIDLISEGERTREDYGNLEELKASLKAEGIIQPIAVKQTSTGYLLLAGGRRYRALKELNTQLIPCRIYHGELTEFEHKSIELAENMHRLDLSWLEKIRLCEQIHNLQVAIHGEKTSTSPGAKGWSKRDTASLLVKSPASIVGDIMLAHAVEKIPELRECKTKDDARKLLMMMQETLVKAELAKRVEENRGSVPVELMKLCDSFIIGDFHEEVENVPNGSIDLVELDPPYAIDLLSVRKLRGPREPHMKYYNEVMEDEYPSFMLKTIQQCYRVLSPSGWIIAWFGPEPWFDPVYQMMRQVGFKGRRIPGIWAKPRGQTMQPDLYLSNDYEMFFYAHKGSGIVKKTRSNLFDFPWVAPARRIHQTERPIEMMEDILSTFANAGSRVMVPFLGSGNTLLAASNLGMQAFGYELSREYKDSFMLRVHEGRFGRYKSYDYSI